MSFQPPPRLRRSRRLTVAIALACGVAGMVLVVAEMSFSSAATSLQSLTLRSQTRTAIQTLMRRLLDAESAQRGYLLTARAEYLEPFRDAQSDISQALAVLSSRYPDDTAWKEQVAVLNQRTLEKLSEVTETMALFDVGQTEAWRSLMLTDIGREKMEGARRAAEALLVIESRNITEARTAIDATLRQGQNGVRVMTLLSLLALIFYFRNSAALDRAQREHARALGLERDLLETEVRQRTAELTELARHLQTAREDERARLARELHDELGALLTASKFDIVRLKRSLGSTPGPDQLERLQQLNASIDQGISLKRRIIEDLRPSALSNLGLKVALEILAREFEQRSGLVVHADVADVKLMPDLQIVIYRIVQESLTNVAKHAMATKVSLHMATDDEGLSLSLWDDGRGLAPGAAASGTHGLVGMRFRVESVGGRMQISSPPGQGTRIEVHVPLPVTEDELSSG